MTLDQFREMTPAGFRTLATARIKHRDDNWRFMDLLNAVQCATLANVNRGRNTPAFSPDGFRVFPDEKKRTDPKEIMKIMDTMVKRQGVKRD